MNYEDNKVSSSSNPQPRNTFNSGILIPTTTNSAGSKNTKSGVTAAPSGSFLANSVPDVPSRCLKRADKFIRNSAKDLGAVLSVGQNTTEGSSQQANRLEEAAKTDRTIVISHLGKQDTEKRAESVQSKTRLEREKPLLELIEKEPTSKSDASKVMPGDTSNKTLGNSTDNSVVQHNNSKTSPKHARKERSLSEKTRKYDRTASSDVSSPVMGGAPLNTGGRNSSVKGSSNIPLPNTGDPAQSVTTSQPNYQKKHKKYPPETNTSAGALASLGATSQSFYGTVGHIISGKKGGTGNSYNNPASPNPTVSSGSHSSSNPSSQILASSLTTRVVGSKTHAQAERTPDSSFVAMNPKQTGGQSSAQGSASNKSQTENKANQNKGLSIYERGEVLANCSVYMRVIKGAAKDEAAASSGQHGSNKGTVAAAPPSSNNTHANMSSVQSTGTGTSPGQPAGGQSSLNSSGATSLVNSNHLKAKKRR